MDDGLHRNAPANGKVRVVNLSNTPKVKTTGNGTRSPGRTSLAERAYVALREEVLNHRLPVGELLNERWLCEQLGYGRTPVREALQRLHQEELVQVVPRKGVLIRPDSISRILDLLDARSIIEPVLAGRAAERATPADVDALKQIMSPDDATHQPDASSVDRFIERDRAFHAKLAEIGGSAVLIEVQKALHERAMRFWYSNLWRTLDEGKAADEHAAVIDAIARGDAPAATRTMAAHIAEITARLRKLQSMAPGGRADTSIR